MTSKSVVACLLASLVAAGAGTVLAKAPVGNTHVLSADDAAFAAGAKEARRTLPAFAAKWRAKRVGYMAFRVKAAFRTDDGRGEEDLWLEPSSISPDGAVNGRISDAASLIASLKQGSEVRIAPGQVVDWMYVKDRRMFGQFTLRAQLNRMPPEQRAQFEAVLSPTPLDPGEH